MRNLILCSIFCAGCFDYAGLSAQYDAGRDGATAPEVDASNTGRDGAISPGADLDGPVDDLAPPGDMACAPQYTHDNGIGKTWVDCVPLGTHTAAQALKACAASFDPSVTCIYPTTSCVGKAIYGYASSGNAALFIYAGSFQGIVTTTGDCTLPMSTTSWN